MARKSHAANNSATMPALKPGGAAGWAVNRDVGAGVAGTDADADDLNMLIAEVANAVTGSGFALDDTGVDLTQLSQAIRAVADGSDTSISGSVSSTRAILASKTSFAGSSDCAVAVAAEDASVEGAHSAVVASTQSTATKNAIAATATASAIVASDDGTVAGDQAIVAASTASSVDATASKVALIATAGVDATGAVESAIIAANGSDISNTVGPVNADAILADVGSSITGGTKSACVAGSDNSIGMVGAVGCAIIASNDSAIPLTGAAGNHNLILASSFIDASAGAPPPAYSIFGGYHGAALGARTWGIESQTGTMRGTVGFATGGLDYAELFPALGGPHGPGRLLARQGRACRLAQPGDRVLGVVSADPTVLGGDDGLGWAGRYLRDEWGRMKHAADGSLTVNPEWEPHQEQIPRSQRPDEWTAVGLLGQLRVAVDETVVADGDVVAGPDGIGTAGEWLGRGAQVECMEIVQAFDAALGYGIALVLVR